MHTLIIHWVCQSLSLIIFKAYVLSHMILFVYHCVLHLCRCNRRMDLLQVTLCLTLSFSVVSSRLHFPGLTLVHQCVSHMPDVNFFSSMLIMI